VDDRDVVAAVVVDVADGQSNAPAGGGHRGQECRDTAVLQRFHGQPAGNRLLANGPPSRTGPPQGGQQGEPHGRSPSTSRSARQGKGQRCGRADRAPGRGRAGAGRAPRAAWPGRQGAHWPLWVPTNRGYFFFSPRTASASLRKRRSSSAWCLLFASAALFFS